MTFPMPRVKPKSGLTMTIDGRGIDANGYRPIRIDVSPLPAGTFAADRQIRVVINPMESDGSSPKISQIIELPEGATSAQATISVPQTSQWYQLQIETFEGGEKLKDLSQDYLGWMTTGYWQWTEASPAILFIDDRVPSRNIRQNSIGALQAQGSDTAPTYELPDIRALAWIFPDPNRGQVNWGGMPPGTTGASPSTPQLSDTTLLMQIQTQMGRVEMLPTAELPERWIDLSQFDVTLISAGDLKALAAQPQKLQALRDWVRGGRVLLVYGAGTEFERLGDFEKQFALPPLPEVADEPEAYRGWTLPDPNKHRSGLQNAYDNLQTAYGPYGMAQSYANTSSAGMTSAEAAGAAGSSGLLTSPTQPPFLQRSAGLGTVVAIAADQPFPGKDTDWIWMFNCVPNNQWAWYQRSGVSMYRRNDDYWTLLIPGVGEAPVVSFLLLVSLFAAVIGPVNYIFLGRARRLYLLLITVPAGAALITGSLFAYAVLTDGLGVRLRSRSFTDLDQTTGQAAGWSWQSYYASIAPSRGLEFPEDCTVFAVSPDPSGGNAGNSSREAMLWDGQQKLQSGFISSRTTVQYMVQRATKSHARLVVRAGAKVSEPPQVENRLGADIRYLLLRDRRGDFYTVSDLGSGKSSGLTSVDPAAAQKQLLQFRDNVLPTHPPGYDPSDRRESVLTFLMPNYNRWGGIDSGNTRPVMAVNLLETNIAVAFHPVRHPPLPGTYIAVLESSPIVPPGVPSPREEASLHVLRGRW